MPLVPQIKIYSVDSRALPTISIEQKKEGRRGGGGWREFMYVMLCRLLLLIAAFRYEVDGFLLMERRMRSNHGIRRTFEIGAIGLKPLGDAPAVEVSLQGAETEADIGEGVAISVTGGRYYCSVAAGGASILIGENERLLTPGIRYLLSFNEMRLVLPSGAAYDIFDDENYGNDKQTATPDPMMKMMFEAMKKKYGE